jgi:hypothetical protein
MGINHAPARYVPLPMPAPAARPNNQTLSTNASTQHDQSFRTAANRAIGSNAAPELGFGAVLQALKKNPRNTHG